MSDGIDKTVLVAIPIEAWEEFEAALRGYATVIIEQWRDPEFYYSPWNLSRQLTYTTNAESNAVRLPDSKYPIRGSEGVEVTVDRTGPVPDASDAIRPFNLVGVGKSRPEKQQQAGAARAAVRDAIYKYEPLRARLARLVMGRWVPKEDLPDSEFTFNFEMMMVDELLGKAFDEKGWSADDPGKVELTDAEIASIVVRLKAAAEDPVEGCCVIALLSGPAIDLKEPRMAWEGNWFDRPCVIEVGYPDDKLCAEVLNETTGSESFPVKALRDMNAFVRLRYSVPLTEDASVHHDARDHVRTVIDLMRLLTPSDVGILHFHGAVTSHQLAILSPFIFVFQDERATHRSVPSRRVYVPPSSAEVFTASEVERLGKLFGSVVADNQSVLGLPVAMDRLRNIYERYAPDELGRLVDATTAIEALFLSDGATDELKFRLQIRVARLLADKLEDRKALADTFSKMYDLRSALVHTGMASKKLQGRAAELQRFALDILRRSILRFIESDFARGKNQRAMRDVWQTLTLS